MAIGSDVSSVKQDNLVTGALGDCNLTYKLKVGKLGSLMRAYRDREGLSLRELAVLADVSHATLSRLENGNYKSNADFDNLIRVINACRIDLMEIFYSGDDDEAENLYNISTQLRASKKMSSATLQALEAVIRALQPQPPDQDLD